MTDTITPQVDGLWIVMDLNADPARDDSERIYTVKADADAYAAKHGLEVAEMPGASDPALMALVASSVQAARAA